MTSSTLALGTVQFGQIYGVANTHGKPSDKEIATILGMAREHRIDLIDTAIAYGDSEERLGHAGVEDFRIVTKLPCMAGASAPDLCAEIVSMVERSLERLRCSSLYAVLLHSPSDLLGVRGEEIREGLEQLMRQGLAAKVGLSAYRPEEIPQKSSLLDGGMIQAPVNVFDRRFLDPKFLDSLKEKHCEVVARSAFLQGLLLLDEEKLQPRFSEWLPLFQSFFAWCRELGVGRIAGCLSIFRHHPDVRHIAVGVETAQQFHEILEGWQASRELPMFPRFSSDERLLLPVKWPKLADE
jgi:aryl-alcohol dehydrogenase-like predicted oxidoreductase